MAQAAQSKQEQSPSRTGQLRKEAAPNDLMHYLRQYAEENPTSAAMWCFGIGFVLGWKLKPW
jgi:hypothetical protein